MVIKYCINSGSKNETDINNQNKLKEDEPNFSKQNEKDSNMKNDSESMIIVKMGDKDFASLIYKLTNWTNEGRIISVA